MMNKKITKILIGLITLVILLAFPLRVEAFDEGGGKLPTTSGPGVWWSASDTNYKTDSGQTSKAFQQFYDAQMKSTPPKFRSEATFKSRVNSSGADATGPGSSLWENCKKSRYVFWYGSGRKWKDPNTNIVYNKESWYTQGIGTNSSGITWNNVSGPAEVSLEQYKDWSKNWDNGKIILICSYSYEKPKEAKELVFKANSGTFTYDGKPKTVSGLNSGSDLSQLQKGHTHKTQATRTETNAGKYEVKFSSIKIYDEKGKDITDSGLYKIKQIPGLLTIKPKIDNPDPTPPDENDRKQWRCIDHETEEVEAIVENTINGSEGFRVEGAPSMRSLSRTKTTVAGEFAESTPLPQRYESLSSWISWSREFTRYDPNATITEELDLENSRISDILSEFGGIYNIHKELKYHTYEATHCQPQERYLEPIERSRIICDRDGCWREYWTEWVWSPWEDVGGRIVWSAYGPRGERPENFNYQILAVNCNKEGFERVLRSNSGSKILSMGNGDGSASLQTRQESGIYGRLGSYGETSRQDFYTGNSSCDIFSCVIDPVNGSDAINNKVTSKGNVQVEYPRNDERRIRGEYQTLDDNKNYLVFFRNNEDNEVRADIWHPQNVNKPDLRIYEDDAAKWTYGYLHRGTPDIDITTVKPLDGAKFNRFGVNDWRGAKSRFIMKSQWSSKEGNPYEMSLLWEYEAEAENKVPAIVDGDKIKEETGIYTYLFDVGCEYNEGSNRPTKGHISERPHVNPRIDSEGIVKRSTDFIRALFVRSTTDKQNNK